MSVSHLVILTVCVLFILAFAVTLVDLWRFRDRTRLDIVLMFATLAALALIEGVYQYVAAPAWLNTLALLILFAHPYLLLTLVQHFQPLPKLIHQGVLLGMVLSWAALIFFPTFPPILDRVLWFYFFCVEVYAAFAFTRGALGTRGVSRWRMRLAALGSASLSLVILLAIDQVSTIDSGNEFTVVFVVLAFISACGYYLGFAPPRWLRQIWQQTEMQHFLQHMMGRPFDERVEQIGNLLCATAINAVGGCAAGIALWQEKKQQLYLQMEEPYTAYDSMLPLDESVIGRVWQNQEAAVVHTSEDLPQEISGFMDKVGADVLLVVPIKATAQSHGLLLLFLRQPLLFIDDDLALLNVLSEEYAYILDHQSALKRQGASEAKFRGLLESAPDAIVIVDRAGRIVLVNEQSNRLFGYASDELVGKMVDCLLPERLHDIYASHRAKYHSSPSTRPMGSGLDLAARHKDGREIPVEISLSPLQTEEGFFINCIIRDVSERKEAQDALNHYASRLATINEMDKAILAAQSSAEIAQAALRHIQALLPYQQASVVVFDSKLEKFRPLAVASTSDSEAEFDSQVNWDEFAAGDFLWSGKAIIQENIATILQPTSFEKYMKDKGIQSYMIIPLMAQGKLIGALNLAKQIAGHFTYDEIRMAHEVAGPMAVAIQQAQLFQVEREQRKLAETLREVARALSTTLNQGEVLQIILDQLARVVDYDGANVMLLSGDNLEIVARKSPADDKQRLTIIEFETLPHVQEVLLSKRSVVIADTANDERWRVLPSTDSIRCWLGTPLIVQDKVIGLLNLNKEEAYSYSQEDTNLVETFAEQAAIAVENSRLYERAQNELRERVQAEGFARQRAAHLGLINDISSEIASVQELSVVLNKAARFIEQIFGYYHVAIFLLIDDVAELKAITGAYVHYFPSKHIQSLEQGVIGWVAKNGQKIMANDIQQESEYISLIPLSNRTQAELCIPIKLAGDTIGVLDIQSPHKHAFTDHDVTTIETLADQVAIAVANSRLYETVREERALLAKRVSERTAELSAANAELARTARSKDEFLANMSHELRTPLNSILSKADIMEEGIYGPLTEKQVHSLQVIKESGHHLLELINDILDVAKIEAGKLTLDVNPVSVTSICDASLRLVREIAHKKQIEIVTNYDDQVKVLLADGRRLKQIVVNLLSNAVKFTPPGGQVGLLVEGYPERQVACFTVWDTGIGISHEDMQRLFSDAFAPKPFMQLDSTLARQFDGTGLGLSLVYSLTELHKGSISVESELGEGSRFTVWLPWEPRAVRAGTQVNKRKVLSEFTAVSPTKPSPDKAVTILLAEDNETNIDIIQEYLSFEGYDVVLARNGHEAIARAEEIFPDLILMDIQMPQMDGLEAIHHLRNRPQFTHTPIIALTALAMPGDRERCLAVGASEYLSKPISLKTLMHSISEQLTKRTAVS